MGISKYERRPRRRGKKMTSRSLIRSSFHGDELVASNYGGRKTKKGSMCVEFRGLIDYNKFLLHESLPRIPKWLADYRRRNGIALPKKYIEEV